MQGNDFAESAGEVAIGVGDVAIGAVSIEG